MYYITLSDRLNKVVVTLLTFKASQKAEAESAWGDISKALRFTQWYVTLHYGSIRID